MEKPTRVCSPAREKYSRRPRSASPSRERISAGEEPTRAPTSPPWEPGGLWTPQCGPHRQPLHGPASRPPRPHCPPVSPPTCQLRVPAERRLRTRGAEARRRGALPPSRSGPVASAEPPAGPPQLAAFHAARAGTGPHARLGARAVQRRRPRPRARACGRSAPACAPEPLNRQKVCAAAPAVSTLTGV